MRRKSYRFFSTCILLFSSFYNVWLFYHREKFSIVEHSLAGIFLLFKENHHFCDGIRTCQQQRSGFALPTRIFVLPRSLLEEERQKSDFFIHSKNKCKGIALLSKLSADFFLISYAHFALLSHLIFLHFAKKVDLLRLLPWFIALRNASPSYARRS